MQTELSASPAETAEGPDARWHRYAVPALLVAHGLACWLARPIGYLTGQDDLEYVALARSLRHGGYNMIFEVGQPLHAQYPPGYPAMLAAWGLLTGDGFDGLALLSVLASVGALAVTWYATRRVFGAGIALVALAVLAVNPQLVHAGGNVASEAPYTLLSLVALALLIDDRRSRHAGAIIAAAVLAALTRSVGVVLIGAVGLHWVIERRWRALGLLAVVSILFVGSWLLWTVASPEQHLGSSYVADLGAALNPVTVPGTLFTRIGRKLSYYASVGVPYALGVPTIAGTPIDNAAAILILAVGVGGGIWILVRKWRPAALLLILYSVLLLLWAWRTERFLTPLLPLLVPTLLAGVWTAMRRAGPRAAATAAGVAAVLLMGGGAARVGATIAEASGCRGWRDVPPSSCVTPRQASFFEALGYIRDNVPAGSAFMVSKPGALWYYTGHPAVSYPTALAQAEERWVPYLKEQNVEWILLSSVGSSERSRFARHIEENCDMLSLEAWFPERTYLFRLVEAGPGPAREEGTQDACEAVKRYLSQPDAAR